jgi:glycosyltransferase involved in cell wall biosynthesis
LVKKILVLSHAFNMDGRAASQTVTDKVPHLLRGGFKLLVVSAVTGARDTRFEHLQTLPWGPAGLHFDLRHLIRQRFQSGLVIRTLLLSVQAVLLIPFLLEKLLMRLESQTSWVFPAYFRSLSRVASGEVGLIYSTGGALSAHLAGLWLKRESGLPWVVEIHDPLIYDDWDKSTMFLMLSRWLEKRICAEADQVYWFTEGALAAARQRNPDLGNRGELLIPGNDRPDTAGMRYTPRETLQICHFGSLSRTRSLRYFLEGLRIAGDRNPALLGDMRLCIYGSRLDEKSAKVMKALGLEGVVIEVGRLEANRDTGESGRQQVLRRMREADCLLLLHGEGSVTTEYIPSKTYEYLWMQRPILGLVNKNPQLFQLLRDLGHYAVGATSPIEVSKAIEDIWMRWVSGRLGDNGLSSPYSTKRSADQLCRRFVELCPALTGRNV